MTRIAAYLASGAVLVAIVLLGARWLVKTGERLQQAEYRASQAEYDRAQLARIQRANDAYRTANQSLQERAAADRASPVVRYIRVPVSTACEAQQPETGVPEPDTGDRSVLVADTGYESLREFLIGYAAGPQHGSGAD